MEVTPTAFSTHSPVSCDSSLLPPSLKVTVAATSTSCLMPGPYWPDFAFSPIIPLFIRDLTQDWHPPWCLCHPLDLLVIWEQLALFQTKFVCLKHWHSRQMILWDTEGKCGTETFNTSPSQGFDHKHMPRICKKVRIHGVLVTYLVPIWLQLTLLSRTSMKPFNHLARCCESELCKHRAMEIRLAAGSRCAHIAAASTPAAWSSGDSSGLRS